MELQKCYCKQVSKITTTKNKVNKISSSHFRLLLIKPVDIITLIGMKKGYIKGVENPNKKTETKQEQRVKKRKEITTQVIFL